MSDGGYDYTACAEDGEIPEISKAQYEGILEHAHRLVDIAPDCWGALFFCVVHDIPALLGGFLDCVGKVRIAFAVVVFSMNLLVQMVLLYFIGRLLMAPSMRSAQNVYKDFTHQSFAGGDLDHDLFNQMSDIDKENVCGLALSQFVFVRVIIFLWMTTNVQELKDIYKKMNDTLAMPNLPDGLDRRLMIHDDPQTRDIEIHIVCMTRRVKCLLFAFIYLPKIIIAIFLVCAGSLWLMSAEKISDLILNSLALAFVTQVDELICNVFFPPFFVHDIEVLSLACQDEDQDPQSRQNRQLMSFLYSALVIVVTISGVELFIRYQFVIPNYHGENVDAVCMPYLAAQVPWCMPGQEHCFPES